MARTGLLLAFAGLIVTGCFAAGDSIPPPTTPLVSLSGTSVRGVVTRIEGDQVTINRGQREGLRVGALLHLVRDGLGLGTIRLERVGLRESSGRIIARFGGGVLYVGDQVVGRVGAAEGAAQPAAIPVAGRVRFEPPEKIRSAARAEGPSLLGYTGLIRIPTAATIEDSHLTLGWGQDWSLRRRGELAGEKKHVYVFSTGFLPQLEVGGAFTQMPAVPTSVTGSFEDRALRVHLLLRPMTPRKPGIAVGSTDLIGTREFASEYLVASRSLGRARLHLGYSRGELEGPLAGLDLALGQRMQLVGEYDTQGLNAGLRYTPNHRLFLSLAWLHGGKVGFGLHYTTALTTGLGFHPLRQPTPLERQPLAGRGPVECLEELQAALVARGFENVAVRLRQSHLVVEYENRVYGRSELPALREVLAQVARRAPPAATTLSLLVKKQEIPVLRLTTAIDDFIAFANGQLSTQDFGHRLDVSSDTDPPEPPELPASSLASPAVVGTATNPVSLPLGPRSRFRADLAFRPGYSIQLGGIEPRTRETLLPDLSLNLGRGLVASVGAEFVLHNELDHRNGSRLTRASMGQICSLTHGIFTQTRVGRFSPDHQGLSQEVLALFDGGRSSLGLKGNWTGGSLFALHDQAYQADWRYRVPGPDVTISLRYDRFLKGDRGWTLDVGRRFGDTEWGYFLTDTNRGNFGGFRFAVPLAPARQPAPRDLRVKVGDFFTFEFRGRTFGAPLAGLGERVVTREAIGSDLLGRERLLPVYLRRHLDQLRGPLQSGPLPTSAAKESPMSLEDTPGDENGGG